MADFESIKQAVITGKVAQAGPGDAHGGNDSPGAYVIKHSDGNIMPIPDLIVDTGIDGLNPIEPAAGMDIGLLKQRYGHRIALIGNIDCGHPLCQAPVDEVRRVTRETVRVAMPSAGYCLSSSNSIHSSVKPANFMAMIETWREFREQPPA